jgi:septal ring factor EnvC (AmiA/AmiB activator)
MTLYEFPAELARLLQEYNEVETTDDRRTEIESALELTEWEIARKADAIAYYIRKAENDAEFVGQEIERLTRLKRRREQHAKGLRGYLARQLNALQLSELETDTNRFSFHTSTSVRINPEANVPIEYCRIVPERAEPNKDLLRNALRQGIEVDGVWLETTRRLTIK